ncbi:hypothetical protein HZI73_26050 (plasmid) [Vallitalea pronyensis]|uniref:Uncharacterized protein n=1 Tax=Vallitalea pronyensis TaxID=1348613 RepID=A0A8J8MR29_9FIRM|nr:hypothetical protein [Vallitalea pronyensis]QUI25878.1 hypothetical protein HZI73_26050 [Vallitalea pronyensis]
MKVLQCNGTSENTKEIKVENNREESQKYVQSLTALTQCTICNNKLDNDEMQYVLKSIDGDIITVCDYCYQEFGRLQKRNGKWIEYITENGKEYFLQNYKTAP